MVKINSSSSPAIEMCVEAEKRHLFSWRKSQSDSIESRPTVNKKLIKSTRKRDGINKWLWSSFGIRNYSIFLLDLGPLSCLSREGEISLHHLRCRSFVNYRKFQRLQSFWSFFSWSKQHQNSALKFHFCLLRDNKTGILLLLLFLISTTRKSCLRDQNLSFHLSYTTWEKQQQHEEVWNNKWNWIGCSWKFE